MKKNVLSCLVLALCSVLAVAQNDTLEPGLYAINNGEPVVMSAINGANSKTSAGILGVEIEKKEIEFKGVTSPIKTDGEFIMVCNMNKKNITRTIKKYDLFVQSMTPDNMLIVPLQVVKNKKRVYYAGKSVNGINTTVKEFYDFTWERITDNSFSIRCNLEPGEYGIVFREAKHGPYNYDTIFDFTVPTTNE